MQTVKVPGTATMHTGKWNGNWEASIQGLVFKIQGLRLGVEDLGIEA